MSIEVKPGWWRKKSTSEIVFLVGKAIGNTYWEFVIERRKSINDPAFCIEYASLDGYEPLPDCSGFDWKPKPKYVPFDRETVPRDAWFRSKHNDTDYRIAAVSSTQVCMYAENIWYDYNTLLGNFTIDGEPAGRLVS